ncbi:ubiquitin carboxyl-terminal hydrolase 4-like [Teratosphaeria destructans]|uniref:Ubiquitin carboxyl-terminal hydrolase 4-like n=1 Tax=Teratosphaeria destructans TaxID=418781 RepID=A0A9W7SL12_9PEZI|nr:ubiquitin carboxyl-terminal hydrolase 4-like [Teratosphaeria destructans]
MSAAAALPYPNGGGMGHGSQTPFNGRGERQFAHIDDLKTLSRAGYNPDANLNTLLETAEMGLRQAETQNSSFRRPDMAWVEYVRAYNIAMEIPQNKEYPTWQVEHPERQHRYRLLLAKLNQMEQQYSMIKEIIVKNNMRHCTQPKSSRNGHARSESGPATTGHLGAGPPKVKPVVSPKPDNLHGRALSTATPSPSADSLVQRMAALSNRPPRINTQNLFDSDDRASITSMSPAGGANGRTSLEKARRPLGPREMFNGFSSSPVSTVPGLPQPPAAAYNPARNMETTGGIAPPRYSARSLTGNTRRSSTIPQSSASQHAPNGLNQSGDYFPGTPNSSRSRRSSMQSDSDLTISAERLFEYVQKYQVLLIDFRFRHEFDEGHIYASSIVCVEPLQARDRVSAEQIAESLETHPEIELDLWNQRNLFDYVVYYDRDTKAGYPFNGLQSERAERLRNLHECLTDYNIELPLQRAPLMLRGGLDAWVDLAGEQSLISSSLNPAREGKGGIRRRPPPTRRPGAAENLRVPKRSLRNINQLDEEEEKRWQARARAESVVLPEPPVVDDNGSEQAIKDFLERFPDAGNLDPQAFASQRPSRLPPAVPAKVVEYPAAPPASTFAQVPTRPQPAAPRMSYTGVSDRAVSASTPTTRQASDQLAPYIPPKLLPMNLRLPRTGLYNFGQTCYMNSIIQACSAILPLTLFFLNDNYKSQLQMSPLNEWTTKGILPDLFANLIRTMWSDKDEVLRPTSFRMYIGKRKNDFKDNTQQDAKEFMDFFLDQLHEDFNQAWDRHRLRELTSVEEAKRESMPRLIVARTEWKRAIHTRDSPIIDIFAGQTSSRLMCKVCGSTSTTHDLFTSIQIEIPMEQEKWRTNGRLPTIEDCLTSYCTEERLGSDEAWNCTQCKRRTESTKTITFTRAPRVLVVQLKRFHTMSKKNRMPVDFPLNDFDLGPYMLPPPTHTEAEAIARDYGAEQLKTELAMTPPYRYDAFAVVRHHGNALHSGHYTTVAKDPARKCWRVFDDTRVYDVQPEMLQGTQRLQNEEAYIVFYQRNFGGGANTAQGRI